MVENQIAGLNGLRSKQVKVCTTYHAPGRSSDRATFHGSCSFTFAIQICWIARSFGNLWRLTPLDVLLQPATMHQTGILNVTCIFAKNMCLHVTCIGKPAVSDVNKCFRSFGDVFGHVMHYIIHWAFLLNESGGRTKAQVNPCFSFQDILLGKKITAQGTWKFFNLFSWIYICIIVHL